MCEKHSDILKYCYNLFSIQASGDRSFKFLVGRQFKHFLLPARLVNGLTKLNFSNRDDVNADAVFLKGLLIGLCTVKGIKESSTFDDGILYFMKGIFHFNEENIQRTH